MKRLVTIVLLLLFCSAPGLEVYAETLQGDQFTYELMDGEEEQESEEEDNKEESAKDEYLNGPSTILFLNLNLNKEYFDLDFHWKLDPNSIALPPPREI